jgi:hypothetical protein
VLDDSGVDGRGWFLGLRGLGVGVSGDFAAIVLGGTGAETRREGLEGLGKAEKLGSVDGGEMDEAGGIGVAFGERAECFEGARIREGLCALDIVAACTRRTVTVTFVTHYLVGLL